MSSGTTMLKPELQQHLPFTVLKRRSTKYINFSLLKVATTPTVYGIETSK